MDVLEHLFNKRLTVVSLVLTPDGAGGYTTGPSAPQDVDCMVVAVSASGRGLSKSDTVDIQLGADITHHIYMGEGEPVSRGSEMADEAGNIYRVDNVLSPSRPGYYKRAEAVLLQTEDSTVTGPSGFGLSAFGIEAFGGVNG